MAYVRDLQWRIQTPKGEQPILGFDSANPERFPTCDCASYMVACVSGCKEETATNPEGTQPPSSSEPGGS